VADRFCPSLSGEIYLHNPASPPDLLMLGRMTFVMYRNENKIKPFRLVAMIGDAAGGESMFMTAMV
jgi:hypothetical protein